MNARRILGVGVFLFAWLSLSIAQGQTLIYNNAQYTGYTFTPEAHNKIFDYGTSPGRLFIS